MINKTKERRLNGIVLLRMHILDSFKNRFEVFLGPSHLRKRKEKIFLIQANAHELIFLEAYTLVN